MMRILYGFDRLPTTLAADDPRLPSVLVGSDPLRLNTEPLPPEAWSVESTHAARTAAYEAWLHASCGDYNAKLRRVISDYLQAVASQVEHARPELEQSLKPFHGLYTVEDICWSALRPLPRAWWRADGTWQRSELAFWNGQAVVPLAKDLGPFWQDQILPCSPFRRQVVISNT